MQGARLEFVLKPVRGGKVERTITSWNPKTKKLEQTIVPEEAGFIVYMPNGHSYRLTGEQVKKRGYDRQPNILNLDKVTDTRSPAGRFKFAIDDKARQKAWTDLEAEVIKNCTRRHGPVTRQKEAADVQAA